MVNSTLKSTFARRNHKERAQPLHRQRLGLLEKHKDYVHRARDYKSKQDRIRKLREKAAFRNKDEFYYGMVKGKTKDGVALGDRGNEALSVDLVKLLKTQDVGYVRLQIAKDEKRIAKLRQELEITAPAAAAAAASGSGTSSEEWTAASELAEVEKLAEMGVVLFPSSSEKSGSAGRGSGSNSKRGKGKGKAPPAGHVVFAENGDDLQILGRDALPPRTGNGSPSDVNLSSAENAEPSSGAGSIDLGWMDPQAAEGSRRKKKAQGHKGEAQETQESMDENQDMEEEARNHRLQLLTSLSAHLARLKTLREAEKRLQTTKSLMGKGSARKVRDAGWREDPTVQEDKNGERKRFEGKLWKWKLERKR